MRLRILLALVSTAAVFAALAGQGGSTASAGSRACGLDVAVNGGYTYAGHQSSFRSHGVRATITATRALEVQAGHVSGWVGVGGPGQGANGEDAWIQVGIAGMHGMDPFLYAEVTRAGRYPRFILLENGIQVGSSRSVAVLEMSHRRGWWRVWVNGNPVTKPIRIRGSSGRWAPIATAESWNGGERACNRFAYRFERVLVAQGRGGAWQPFVSGHRFLDGGNKLKALATAPAQRGQQQSRQLLSLTKTPAPYAFIASS